MTPPPKDPADAARSRDRAIGLSIVIASFLVTLGLSYWSRGASAPAESEAPAPPSPEEIVGWPEQVDPVATLSRARALTERRRLAGIVAANVKRDGTLDFREKASRVRYAFQDGPGQGPQPPHPPGTLPKRSYCGKQNVHVREDGAVADPDVANFPCPAQTADALADPSCTMKNVWDHAAAKGAAEGRPARIEYYRSKAGPAWRFEIPGSSIRFSLYGDCGRELDAGESVGSVP